MAAILPLIFTSVLINYQGTDNFVVVVENKNVAPVEVYVAYRTGSNRMRAVHIPPNSQRRITVDWKDEPFFVGVGVLENGMFEPTGGGWPKRQRFYTNLMDAEVGQEISIEIPRRLEGDARFRRDRP